MLAWRSRVLLCRVLLASAVTGWAQSALPDAPTPQTEMANIAADVNAPWLPSAALGEPAAGQETFPPAARPLPGVSVPGLEPTYLPPPRWCTAHACTEAAPQRTCCEPDRDVFGAYLHQDAIHIYSPAELGRIAIHGVVDPFNLLTIGTSVLSVATDSHSLYGPGVKGWAKLSGVTLTEDMTGEFVGTFLIPSIDHQDPHYHRMPNASLMRRILHCAYQPFWTTSDTGKGMINYSTFAGSIGRRADRQRLGQRSHRKLCHRVPARRGQPRQLQGRLHPADHQPRCARGWGIVTCPIARYSGTLNSAFMILSFRDHWLRDFFLHNRATRKVPANLSAALFRKVQIVDDATSDADLRVPPGNRFEKLRGQLEGWHSIRVNEQWRLIFRWNGQRGEASAIYLDNHSYR
jgi:proteic killer suppression protein